jgi:two-component system LytT family response regulator
MIKVILVDDEPLAISVLQGYLKSFPEFDIVATCQNGFEALKAIQQHQPDLLFLDIQMPKITGLELLELLENPPAVIFTTAFDEFAIKAFEANAIDYLLKPISEERFAKALSKWADKNTKPSDPDLTVLPDLKTSETHKRIVVKSGNNIRIIPFEEIRYVEAYDDYIKIHILNDCFLKKQTMQKTEEMLLQHNFLRVHRSYIVQLDQITRIEALGKESFIAKLTDNTQIPLSKTGYLKIKSTLGI